MFKQTLISPGFPYHTVIKWLICSAIKVFTICDITCIITLKKTKKKNPLHLSIKSLDLMLIDKFTRICSWLKFPDFLFKKNMFLNLITSVSCGYIYELTTKELYGS